MKIVALFCCGLLVIAALASRQKASAAGLATQAAVSRPTTLPAPPTVTLDRPTLEKMYQAELGASYNPADYSKLFDAHILLEQYFASSSSAQRKWFVSQIEAAGVDRTILGKIARIHLDWPALAGGVYYVNEKIGPHIIKYFFGIPKDYDRTRPWPLVIKLPTAQAFTTDPPPDGDRVAQIYTQWIDDELTAHPDAIVLMPLLNLDYFYGPSTTGMNLVIQPMLHITGKVNINPAQVYLIGHSMAAHATWNIPLHYPTYFAAINPLAGAAPLGWQRQRLGNLRNILPVVWADTSDDVIKSSESKAIVDYLHKMKYDVDYTETTDLGHMPSPQILSDEYTKMRARTRELYPREVYLESNKPESIFNRADWLQIYQPLDPGEEQKFRVAHSGEYMFMNQRSSRMVATIVDRHTIALATSNVQTFRLYLNDQLVDLTQPITVIVDKRQRFQGLIPQSTDEMLKDQTFLGRGWRYYTAVLDLDLTEPTTQPTTQSTTEPSHHGSIEFVLPNGEHKTYGPK